MSFSSSPPKRRSKATPPDTGLAQLLAKSGNLIELKAQMVSGALTLKDLNAPDAKGDTALLYAVFNNQRDTWQWLIEKNVDIRHANAKGDTVLHHIAARFVSGDDALADLKQLIAKGADLNAVNHLGQTPVVREALRHIKSNWTKESRPAHMLTLVEAGADVFIPNLDGRILEDYVGPVVFEWLAAQRVARTPKAEDLFPGTVGHHRSRIRP